MTQSRQLPPLRLLTVFEAIARHRSLSLAARTLNVSQPAISKSLRDLEQWIGAPLLHRNRRPLTLTEEGEVLLIATRDGLGMIADAIAQIGRLQAERDRSLRVSCSIGFATYWLMVRLSSFGVEAPDIGVSVMTTPHDAAPDAPHADVMFRYGHGRWRDGEVIPLFQERIDPVAAPDFLDGASLAPDRLDQVPLIHVDVDDASWRSWNGYLAKAGLTRKRSSGDLRFNNYVQATQAAMAGQGVMLGWLSVTGDLVTDRRLRPVGLPPVIPEDGAYYLVVPARSTGNTAVARFIDWLRRQVADMSPVA
ncbi:LysR substrate binding domain protein [Novosphingobium nitrogenifigens DSM 19370]|uniref:LysR substrate binding domain protein n=1 Tax=Novosphingobium nitrogenifigens DSM 19370 TaxID=983920 RepID=F1ZAM4_9SPHN|nr:LysR substrate-binding domain-containing protein [Novosphingobium nitrogenifigens]EGD58339.1 LysR substrate binding domain protein [Novosphingobium nitrogenifigens DSM 19370]